MSSPDVKHQLSAEPRPPHLALFAHALIDQLVHRRFDVGSCDPFALAPSSSVVRQRADVRIEIAFEFVEALASGSNFRKIAASGINFITMRKQLRTQSRRRYDPSRMARLAVMPDIPAHAAQIASVTGEPFVEGWLVIIDRPIDASPEPLNSAAQVKPIQPMFSAPLQPLTSHQSRGVLFVAKNSEIGRGPTSGAAKSGANPLTREIIEVADRDENFALAPASFDPAEDDLEIPALIFRERGFDKCTIDANDHLLDGLLGDFGSRFCLDHLSHGQNPILCRRVIETRDIGEKFVRDVGSLLIGKLAAKLGLQISQFRRERCGKRTAMREGAAEPPQAQASKRGS